MRSPLFSIVIANYNYGRFLEEAIQSVLSQSCQDFELIICDGGSTDNSVEVIKKHEARLAWWCSEPDKGQSDAFNKGFSHAKGRFLTWLNADDVLTSGALAAVAHEIERHPSCEWFVGSSVWTDADLRIHRCFCAHRFSRLRARHCTISAAGPSSFFSRRLYESVGRIDEGLHYVMDTDLWHKFYARQKACYRRTRHNVWAYRQHEASKMSGADEHSTPRALENRKKAGRESQTLAQRYGARCGFFSRLVSILTVSPIDHMVAGWRNRKWKGLLANEI